MVRNLSLAETETTRRVMLLRKPARLLQNSHALKPVPHQEVVIENADW